MPAIDKEAPMLKRVIYPGLLGGVVLLVWTFLVNGVFGFKSSIDMKRLTNERVVYQLLKEQIDEPGRYICNPDLTPERMFPDNEPVFTIMYSGMGHEAAGGLMLFGLFGFFLGPIVGSWMLSQASDKVLASYMKKVLFFASIGCVIVLFSVLPEYGIGGYPLSDALLMGVHDIVVWTLVGMVVAWRMRPEGSAPVME
jgi:hypothetical protein